MVASPFTPRRPRGALTRIFFGLEHRLKHPDGGLSAVRHVWLGIVHVEILALKAPAQPFSPVVTNLAETLKVTKVPSYEGTF